MGAFATIFLNVDQTSEALLTPSTEKRAWLDIKLLVTKDFALIFFFLNTSFYFLVCIITDERHYKIQVFVDNLESCCPHLSEILRFSTYS